MSTNMQVNWYKYCAQQILMQLCMIAYSSPCPICDLKHLIFLHQGNLKKFKLGKNVIRISFQIHFSYGIETKASWD